MASDITALEAYQRRKLFAKTTSNAGWEGFVSQGVIVRTRDIFSELLDELIQLGSDPTHDRVEDAFRRAVEKTNELDGTFDGFTTIEREDLCEALYEIGSLCGMPEDEEWVDKWRAW